ncbi:protein prenyltransferase alpha subunit repeat-containing domain protein [Teladorsagia circumcincta]|uniref:Protein farnesyltransferase/geranylgeranyltransferase type-1 subunit alpha n=1 Tax=Teladorsagia circumcincta TaxID=45464 RepID=A0A2G9U6Z4_TELCI|nr:protein prenyltransferase alpha subunit repeat-containing domain protein [Teladorsagia circumcincta]
MPRTAITAQAVRGWIHRWCADMENNGEVSSSAFYRDNPDWADVKPIYPSKEEDGAVRIAVTEQFRDAFAYLRAVLASGEMSSRVFLLTEDCIQLNPANYTLWQFRRELLKKLGIDLRKELKYLDDVIMQTPKNYQVWIILRKPILVTVYRFLLATNFDVEQSFFQYCRLLIMDLVL